MHRRPIHPSLCCHQQLHSTRAASDSWTNLVHPAQAVAELRSCTTGSGAPSARPQILSRPTRQGQSAGSSASEATGHMVVGGIAGTHGRSLTYLYGWTTWIVRATICPDSRAARLDTTAVLPILSHRVGVAYIRFAQGAVNLTRHGWSAGSHRHRHLCRARRRHHRHHHRRLHRRLLHPALLLRHLRAQVLLRHRLFRRVLRLPQSQSHRHQRLRRHGNLSSAQQAAAIPSSAR